MGGFLDALATLAGGFNDLEQIKKDGFDFRSKRIAEDQARQQQILKDSQANQDWATKAGAEAALGAPEGTDLSTLIPATIGNERMRRDVAMRVGGASAQSKSALAGQKAQTDAYLQSLKGSQALDLTQARGEIGKMLLQERERIRADATTSPREKDAQLAALDRALQVAGVNQAGANARHDAGGENKLYPITTTDAKGNTIQTFINDAKARELAASNSGQGGMTGIAKPEGQTVQARVRGAAASLQVGNELLRELGDPEVKAKLGPVMGRYSSIEAAAGAGDPIAMRIYGEIKSFSALQPGIHGMRATSMMKDIEDSLRLGQTPEALSAKIQGINRAAEALINPNAALSEGPTDTMTYQGKNYRLKPGADRRLKSSWEELP